MTKKKVENDQCPSCEEFFGNVQKLFTCADKPNPFSREEYEIFQKLLAIKNEVRLLKENKEDSSQRLEELREEWKRWKQESAEAARRRMIALGHIDPEDDY